MFVNLPSSKYPHIFKEIVIFSTKLITEIDIYGQILNIEDWPLAYKCGVSQPYKIKILYKEFSFEKSPKLRVLAAKTGIDEKKVAGVSLGYHLQIHPKYANNDIVLLHEFRHIAQYVACDSLEHYLEYYLMEVIYFGYGHGPLENDALLTSNLKFVPINEKN